jgi:hypothetical protein
MTHHGNPHIHPTSNGKAIKNLTDRLAGEYLHEKIEF